MAPKGKIVPITCPLCSSSFKKTTAFDDHVVTEHQTTTQLLYDQTYGKKLCQCGCSEATTWRGWKNGYATCIVGHNAAIYDYYDHDEALRLSKTRQASMQAIAGWSKGLTKETDARVAARATATKLGKIAAFASGQNVAWNAGLTKETDERVEKAANDKRQAYAEGTLVPWSRGLTKDNDDRLKRLGDAVSLKLREKDVRTRLDELKRLSHEEITKRINSTESLTLIGGLDSYVNDKTKSLLVRCNRCNAETHVSLRSAQKGRCFACSPGGSIAQTDVIEFCRSISNDVIMTNVRSVISPQEIDVWFPDKQFGIEYNGLYYHSEIHKPSSYHADKTAMYQRLGIRLFHVFEDEWRDKRRIVESMIMARLGILPQRLHARRCSIVELDSKSREEFFEANHLDGDVNAEASWGLKDVDGRIVFALSVRKPFHRSLKDKLEVARTCTVAGATVAGGLSRLTNRAAAYAADTGRTCLMTYVDARLGNSGSYAAAGWTKKRATPPRFWWTDLENRFNRFKFKADKERGMSEALVAAEAGVVKIWGCPNDVYETNVS